MKVSHKIIAKTLLVSWGLAVLASLYSSVLLAQQEPSQTPELEVIVVTANRRVEKIQEVPVAISALSGDVLQALRVTKTSDLVNITPGLTARQQSGSNRNYFLRGVGTNDFHLTSASAVGQYFDDVTLTSGFHSKASLFDMERIEILKGPQNTLFGLNSTGGAINFMSVKPDIKGGTEGHLNLRLGNYSLTNLDVAVGFDITDKLSARVSAYLNRHDGAFDSSFDGRDYGDDDTRVARIQLLGELGDNTEALLNLHFAKTDSNGTPKRALGSRAPDGSENIVMNLAIVYWISTSRLIALLVMHLV